MLDIKMPMANNEYTDQTAFGTVGSGQDEAVWLIAILLHKQAVP